MNKFSISIFLFISLIILSCKKTDSGKTTGETVQETFYQKEIPYEGLSQECDSLRTNYFSARENNGSVESADLLMSTIKRFNADGYLLSQECMVYDDEGLLSVESILYRRDSINQQTEEKVNYLERSGQGYSITYNLVDRFENTETWEKIQQSPRLGLELKAEIREYEKDKVSIFSQVGVSDSVVASREYFYNDNGLLEKTIQYNSTEKINSELIKYNNDKLPITITKNNFSDNSPIKESIETREYIYTGDKNPSSVEIYIDGEPVSVMEHNYYFRSVK